MNVLQFSHPAWLWLLIPTLGWTVWLAYKTFASLTPWRRWVSTALRVVGVLLLVFSLAGLQWKRPQEGMNTFFLLDRSDSIPSSQQEESRAMANRWARDKAKEDRAGFLVFGADAALETEAREVAEAERIQAVIDGQRTDVAAAVRLGTAAFPETGQKRLVLFSDGHENVGDAVAAVLGARSQQVRVDVVPIGAARRSDVSIQRLQLPTGLKKGQTFEAKIFALSDAAQSGTVRLYRNGQLLGSQPVQLDAGKNLFSFPQTLIDPGFYQYEVQIDAPGDSIPQNNRATSFVNVREGDQILVISAIPSEDQALVAALIEEEIEVDLGDISSFPDNLPAMTSYDAIILSNIAAGDLGFDMMRLLESAVRDFGVGLVVIGGDNAFAAGGYRNTPLETALPLDMELSSKKVLPNGALALLMHGMEFGNGNEISRQIAIAALDSLGPQDEMGVLLWDGTEKWLFELQKVGDKRALAVTINGMNQGDLPSFQGLMQMGHDGLVKSTANLKHMIVFSDGDPNEPNTALMNAMTAARVTISTIMIGGHVQPDTMIRMAELGGGRFYDVKSAAQLPQIFIKEAAVILKSAIFEDPFQPQIDASTELIRGFAPGDFPMLRGYVTTTPKPRAEIPLITERGDPLLAHWQYGLGRSVAFTSDAKSRWAQDWMGWPQYRQFWAQTIRWALRRVEMSEFSTEVTVDDGIGRISVEALDVDGDFRNFLRLRTAVVSPKGERQDIVLEQTGPGRYEGRFDTRDVGSYLMNLQELNDQGQIVGSQILGASVNYSPEFSSAGPNMSFLRRLAELGGGQLLDPQGVNPFQMDRRKTFQPVDLWEWLLQWMVGLFVLDIAVRRVDIDREEWGKWWRVVRRRLGFGDPKRAAEGRESLGALLARRDSVRTQQTGAGTGAVLSTTQPARPSRIPQVPRADLFKSRQDPVVPTTDSAKAQPAPGDTGPAPAQSDGGTGSSGTTSRLLAAKRRAQKQTGTPPKE